MGCVRVGELCPPSWAGLDLPQVLLSGVGAKSSQDAAGKREKAQGKAALRLWLAPSSGFALPSGTVANAERCSPTGAPVPLWQCPGDAPHLQLPQAVPEDLLFGSWVRRECHGQGGNAREGLPRFKLNSKGTGVLCVTSAPEPCLGRTKTWAHPFPSPLISGWVLPNEDNHSEYVPEELGLAIWQRTFHRKPCRTLLLLLSSVPKEGTIPAPPRPPPLWALSFLHPKIPSLYLQRCCSTNFWLLENFGRSWMLLSPRAAWC
ncbi:uncharacterized protein LOC106630104 [Zonotrichia albicollis]|uniref:uncharacterized protein LOC106630104 n=1 Tax=Zonotrichia albicollis TaxID=44394 RepID=UPI003D80D6B8